MERHGYRSVVAERIREQYQARVESRLQRSAEQSPVAVEPKSMEEIRRQSVENWLRWRETQPKLSAVELQRQSIENWQRGRETEAQSKGDGAARTLDDEHSL